MKVVLYLLFFLPSVAAFGNKAWPAKKVFLDVVVGTTYEKIPASQARLAPTGQKKIFKYTLYAKQNTGKATAIQKVEFFPDIKDWTYQPAS